ncbi:MAG: GNAT family N-acetyltransferase [Flavobacteriia bacterium]|nr:GNAT family N-acetyltransferase [Flavobacteriia bacterium]MBH2023196.1 GNAT family N-acetyltransferase [Flavobacteriales bacterium]
MKVRKATNKDIINIVEIHLQRFSSFFLTSLGKSFLKVFYKAFLKNPGILLVLEDGGQIRGFAAGSRENRGFFKKLLMNNLFGFTISGARILLTNPLALKRIAQNAGKAEKNRLIFAELLSIATLENKKGYGKILLGEFEREVARENSANLPVSLTTDYDNNERAVQFYRDNGFEIYEIFESYQKRKMYRFLK